MKSAEESPTVLVIGGGITGITAANTLYGLGVRSILIEKRSYLGGHAVELACKATDQCQQCSACCVEEQLRIFSSNQKKEALLSAELTSLRKNNRSFIADITQHSSIISKKCDALLLATGFTPVSPLEKAHYGFGIHKNVVSALSLEQFLRQTSRAIRPSDGREPDRIAFIQCVGSREKGRPYCSRVCCAYALRMAGAINFKRPETQITIFYIDIQPTGKEFSAFYKGLNEKIRMIRMIPGDVYQMENHDLKVSFMDPLSHQMIDDVFGLVVLSVGILPGRDNKVLSDILQLLLDESGFFPYPQSLSKGLFVAGTARGPMGIPEAIADGRRAALEAAQYCRGTSS